MYCYGLNDFGMNMIVSNFYTHVHNCELEERDGKSIDFSLTDYNGRCQQLITVLNTTDNSCSTLIKCAMTLHPTCAIFGMLFNTHQEAIRQIYILCPNQSQIVYASGSSILITICSCLLTYL